MGLCEAQCRVSLQCLMLGQQQPAPSSCWPAPSYLDWGGFWPFGGHIWLEIWGQAFFSLNSAWCRAEGCSPLLLSPAKGSVGPCLTMGGNLWRDHHTATDCSRLSRACFVLARPLTCAPWCMSLTCAGLVLCWWEWRARKMPMFLLEGRL